MSVCDCNLHLRQSAFRIDVFRQSAPVSLLAGYIFKAVHKLAILVSWSLQLLGYELF